MCIIHWIFVIVLYNDAHEDISYEYLLSSNPYEYSLWSAIFSAAFKLRAHGYGVCLHQLLTIFLYKDFFRPESKQSLGPSNDIKWPTIHCKLNTFH